MSSDSRARFRLSVQELLFLGGVMLFWGAFVIVLGKDTSWDFRNYHWYAPYAFLNNRMGFDIAVAHHASYFNPFLDIPFYVLATRTHAWIALGVLGMVQGATIAPLYLIAREGLRIADNRLAAGALALISQFGALTLTEFGTTYYDNVMAVFVFSGLALIIVRRDYLKTGPLLGVALTAALAGFLTGCAMGLKLPEEPFCVGFAAALLVLGGDLRHLATRLIAGGIGGVLGFGLFSAWWMIHIWHLTGNPVFPFFNDYWRSPLVLAADYRDMRFIRPGLWWQFFFPVYFSIDWHVADDLGFQDFRVVTAYFAVIAAIGVWLAKRQSKDPLVAASVSLPLFAFAAVSYFVWLRMFAIYRYIILLEMLAPLLILAAIGLMPVTRRARYLVLAGLAFAILVTARTDFLDRAPVDDPYIQVALPPIPRPDRTMVLMTGDAPMGFIAPALPRQIPILRVDGWLVMPRDGTRLTADMKARVAAHLQGGGDLYLIAEASQMERARTALKDYDLAIGWTECQQFDTNLTGTYQWCPLARKN